jgi:hypothetical protein
MNILFDLSASQPNSSKYHGGGEYAKAVFEHLISLNKGEKINRKIIACYNPNKWLDPSFWTKTISCSKIDLRVR